MRIYEGLASLKLAVVVIGGAAIVLGWGTFVEKNYGPAAAHFGVYGTWWFAALNALLGINVLCAALVRFPWKRHQTGFVVTHAGILVLLVGTLVSRLGGIDAQLPVFEGQSEHVAFEDAQHFELSIASRKTNGASTASSQSEQVVEIPFVSGPFNWQDYQTKLWPFPWWLPRRDRGVLYDHDGIKLEVLDYLSSSDYAQAEPLKLKVRSKAGADAASGQDRSAAWQEIELGVRRMGDPDSPHGRMGLGSRERLPGGQRLVFWTADSRAATEAFLQSRPEGALGDKGLVVLHAYGKRYQFPVDELLQRRKMPIGDTGMELEVFSLDEQFLGLVLLIHSPGEPPQRMVLFGDVPEFSQQDTEHGLYGTYWVDVDKMPKAESDASGGQSMREAARQPRIDILEGTDGKLYYRTWNSPKFGTIGRFLTSEKIVAFAGSDDPVTLAVERFVPSDKPGRRVVPAPFVKQNNRMQVRQARVRLTVDGQSEEFWLEGLPPDPRQQPQPDQRKVVIGDHRRVAVTLPRDKIDVGFGLYLHRFERKLDPGTSQASWYASLVDLVDREDPQKKLQEKVLITLNEPVNFTDPATRRSYRVYQESFGGPFKPGDPVFDSVAGGLTQRDELFLSWLTFNYDPGRGLKYFGSLLIVAGIGTMFYMRAYFFRRRETAEEVGDEP